MRLLRSKQLGPGRCLDGLGNLPVGELFGCLPQTPVGSGRPRLVLPKVDADGARAHIEAARAKGIGFNYVLNAPCMGNMEYDKAAHGALLEHLAWIDGLGVDAVTVTIPYLLRLIKKQFPRLKVKVSVIAHVNTVAMARQLEDLGADEINLDYMLNRDFRRLHAIRKAVSCELSLLVNDLCLYQCPYRQYHYNITGHSTQKEHPLQGAYFDFCMISCTIEKLTHPEQLIRARWIRPEDLQRYEEIGFQRFKVSGRNMSSAWITRAVRAYADRSYPGNLGELLAGLHPRAEWPRALPDRQWAVGRIPGALRDQGLRSGGLHCVRLLSTGGRAGSDHSRSAHGTLRALVPALARQSGQQRALQASMNTPSTRYLRETLGLEHAIVGLYDLPSVQGIAGVIERRGCLFACFENWQRGESVHLCRARPGCPGSSKWLCGAQALTDEMFLEFLVDTEGLKPDCAAMQSFLDVQSPYAMRGAHLLIGPLADERHSFLRTVTFFCNADQLSALSNAVFYLSPPGRPTLLVPSYGPGCLQLAGVFPELEVPAAVISSLDMAMRIHLPPDVLSMTVTRPLFEQLCGLDDASLLGRPFWRRLRRRLSEP